MIDRKRKNDVALEGMSFDEALSRFLTVSPRELTEAIEQDAVQTRERIKKIREEIENAGRPRKGRFRL